MTGLSVAAVGRLRPWWWIGGALAAAVLSVALTFALLGLNLVAAGADRTALRAHVEQAFAQGDLVDAHHLRTNTKEGAHQYNDCLILKMALDTRAPAEQRALSPLAHNEFNLLEPCMGLREFLSDPDAFPVTGKSFYHRYIHGHTALATALVSAAPLRYVRLALDVISFAAVVGLLAASVMKLAGALSAPPGGLDGRRSAVRAAMVGLAALVILLFYGLQFYGMSLSHFPSDMVILAYLWCALFIDFDRWPRWRLVALHAVFGALTAYFEFLTGGIPLGVCLIFFVAAANAGGKTREEAVDRAILSVGAFMGAIVAAFVAKVLVTAAVFGPSVFADFGSNLAYRTVGKNNVNPVSLLVGLFAGSHYLGAGWRLLGVLLLTGSGLLALGAWWTLYQRRAQAYDWPRAALLTMAVLAIVGWWAVFAQHSMQHAFFMVRIAVGLIAGTLALAWLTWSADLAKLGAAALALMSPRQPAEKELQP